MTGQIITASLETKLCLRIVLEKSPCIGNDGRLDAATSNRTVRRSCGQSEDIIQDRNNIIVLRVDND